MQCCKSTSMSTVQTCMSKTRLHLCNVLLGVEQAWARWYSREGNCAPQSSVTPERGLHPCGVRSCLLDSGVCLPARQHGVSSKSAVQGLQQEVARRQMAVLERTSASPDLPQTMHERQASLRCGHTLQQSLCVAGHFYAVLTQEVCSSGELAVRLFEASVMM